MVSSLSYSFHQNLIIDLLTELNTLQVRNVIFYVSTGLNIPKIHIYLNLFLMFYNQTPEILLTTREGLTSSNCKISLEIQKIVLKKVIVGSISETGGLLSGVFTRDKKTAIKECS